MKIYSTLAPLMSVVLLATTSLSHAQSLSDQINAVDHVYQQERATKSAQQREQARQAAQKAQVAKLAEKKRQAAITAKQEAKLQAQRQDKERDQKYEDELRALALEKQRLQLELDRAKAQRANDYVDQELREKSARTDVIQSEADANRHLSEGSNALLKSKGKSLENQSSSWW